MRKTKLRVKYIDPFLDVFKDLEVGEGLEIKVKDAQTLNQAKNVWYHFLKLKNLHKGYEVKQNFDLLKLFVIKIELAMQVPKGVATVEGKKLSAREILIGSETERNKADDMGNIQKTTNGISAATRPTPSKVILEIKKTWEKLQQQGFSEKVIQETLLAGGINEDELGQYLEWKGETNETSS